MATGGREHPETAGIAPAAQRGRGNTQHATGFRQAYPIAIGGFTTGQTYSNLVKGLRPAYHTTPLLALRRAIVGARATMLSTLIGSSTSWMWPIPSAAKARSAGASTVGSPEMA